MSKIYPDIYAAPLMNLGYKKIDDRISYKPFEETYIMFRIVQIREGFYFAEEIATGAIFPMGKFLEKLDGRTCLFHNFSYCILCGNYITLPIVPKSDFLGQIKIDENYLKRYWTSPTTEEVNRYLVNHRHSIGHKKKNGEFREC